MIRLVRGDEPEALVSKREQELLRVGALAAVANPTSDEIGTGYSPVRNELYHGQFYKCAFCEMKEQQSYNDVEHFRPKAEADRSPGSPLRHGYWWLTWTWENLLFACQVCNRSSKRIQFPLAEGSVPLGPGEKPPGGETPLLIDPYTEDPIDFIQFRLANLNGRDCWRPFARNGSEKGDWTIRVAKLDRPELLDHYEEHVKEWVQPRAEEVAKALETGNHDEIREVWDKTTKRLLNPRQPFAALSHDALDHFVPFAVRSQYDLELRRPRA